MNTPVVIWCFVAFFLVSIDFTLAVSKNDLVALTKKTTWHLIKREFVMNETGGVILLENLMQSAIDLHNQNGFVDVAFNHLADVVYNFSYFMAIKNRIYRYVHLLANYGQQAIKLDTDNTRRTEILRILNLSLRMIINAVRKYGEDFKIDADFLERKFVNILPYHENIDLDSLFASIKKFCCLSVYPIGKDMERLDHEDASNERFLYCSLVSPHCDVLYLYSTEPLEYNIEKLIGILNDIQKLLKADYVTPKETPFLPIGCLDHHSSNSI